MKSGQFMSYYKRKKLYQKFYKNCSLKTSSRSFCVCKEWSITFIGKWSFWSKLLILDTYVIANLWKFVQISINCKVHSVYHGTQSLSFLGPKIWDLVQVELKQSETLYSFKLKIRNWVPFECPCRICKTYIQQVGFL